MAEFVATASCSGVAHILENEEVSISPAGGGELKEVSFYLLDRLVRHHVFPCLLTIFMLRPGLFSCSSILKSF